ncbi:MAG: hypothetical protein LBM98_01655 [Oscillospiraceae bacterium]|nr:hypothetical protein [Oscillospiraceae bacterium]
MNNYEGRTRRCLRQPWIASPRFNVTYRKCGGGFAKTGRAKPCPAPCAWCAVPAPRHCEPRKAIQAPYPRPTPRNYSLSIVLTHVQTFVSDI